MTYWFVLYLFIYLALEALSVVAFKFAGRVILLFIYLFIVFLSLLIYLFIFPSLWNPLVMNKTDSLLHLLRSMRL